MGNSNHRRNDKIAGQSLAGGGRVRSLNKVMYIS